MTGVVLSAYIWKRRKKVIFTVNQLFTASSSVATPRTDEMKYPFLIHVM